jgi:hypothetical protein
MLPGESSGNASLPRLSNRHLHLSPEHFRELFGRDEPTSPRPPDDALFTPSAKDRVLALGLLRS